MGVFVLVGSPRGRIIFESSWEAPVAGVFILEEEHEEWLHDNACLLGFLGEASPLLKVVE